MLGKLQQQQSSRIRLERQFLYLEKNLLRVMYHIVPIFAEKIDFSRFKHRHFYITLVTKGAIGKM